MRKNRSKTVIKALVIISGLIFNTAELYARQDSPDNAQLLSIDVKETDIRDVVRMISKGYDLNIILDNDVSGKVTLHLSSVPVMEGLSKLAKSHGWEVVKDKNIFRIKKAEEPSALEIIYQSGRLSVDANNVDINKFVEELAKKTSASIVTDNRIKGRVSGKLYKVLFEDGLRAILESNGFKMEKRNNIYRITYGEEAQASGGQRSGSRPRRGGGSNMYIDYSSGMLTIDVMNRDIYQVVEEIADQSRMEIVIYGRLSGDVNAVLNDIEIMKGLELLLSGTKFTCVEKNGVLLIGDRNTATPSGQALSKSELIHLDHIKADEVPKILPKNIPASNLKIVKEQNGLLVSGTSVDISKTRDFLETIDIPTPQVLLDVVVVEYTRNMDQNFGLEAGINKNKQGSSAEYPYLQAHGGENALSDVFSYLNFPKSFTTSLSQNFYMTLRLLEQKDKANVLARPSLTVLNGNKAHIDVSHTRYFEIHGGTADNPTSNFRPINYGIKLDITPWISSSGQITVEVSPNISNAAGVNEQGYPNVFKRSLQTTVRIDNNKTLVLGGLLQEDESVSHKEVPILSKIPLLGYLFKTTVKKRVKTNLVIYITPKIIEKNDYVDLESELKKLNIDKRSKIYSKEGIMENDQEDKNSNIKKDSLNQQEIKTDDQSSLEKENRESINQNKPVSKSEGN